MDVQYRRCCGLDVHRDTVVACLLDADAPAARRKQVRTFATTSEGLLALAAWLQAADCGHVAMEATGVYWKPVVRHEALLNREGMRGPLQRTVAAVR